MAESSKDVPPSAYGFGSQEDEFNAKQDVLGNRGFFYRPLERLKYADYSELNDDEKIETHETLKTMVLEGHTTLASRLDHSIEDYNYKKIMYSVQREAEIAASKVDQLVSLRMTAKEGQNERLLGYVEQDLIRLDSANRVFSWSLAYKNLYWSGMDSLGILAQRGEQLALANMDRVVNGTKADWLSEPPENVPDAEIDKWNKALEYLPLVEKGETMSDRYGNYLAETDFWFRAIGEVDTYNPTTPGEELNLSKPMQALLGDLLQRRPRTYEDGKKETVELPTRRIVVYLDDDGNQVPADKDGKPVDPSLVKETKPAYVEVLDYYNKSRSEEEMRWVISVTSSLAVNKAKDIVDSLPNNLSLVGASETDENYKKYETLQKKVFADAQVMMKNYDSLPKRYMNLKLARSALFLSDSISFASFDIAERGYNNEWKPSIVDREGKPLNLDDLNARVVVRPDGKVELLDKGSSEPINAEWFNVWHVETSQGDPTASGDAFTAAKRYFHEMVYQAVKNRISANNNGVLMAIDEKEAERMAQVYVSEIAEANDRKRVLELIKSGKQQHLAQYFGILGAFKEELGHIPSWQAGEKKRIKLGKKINPNLSKAIEDTVVFVPTPYNFKHVKLNPLPTNTEGKYLAQYVNWTGLTNGENLLYPMVTAQYPIGLYDMLSAGKEFTVGDLLRKVWKKDENGILEESSFEEGGKRLTYKDIHWKMYARYADDGRAVNNNFMLQAYAPLYGALDEKQIETVKQKPSAAITAGVKFGDIGFRSVIKKFTNPTEESGKVAKRQSLEIMHSASVAFQQLALGVHGLIGRGSIKRYQNFVEELTPAEKQKQSDNLYSVLRTVEDFITNKQGYSDYSDSFYCMFLAQSVVLQPITIASEDMAYATTLKFDKLDPTGINAWQSIVDTQKSKKRPVLK